MVRTATSVHSTTGKGAARRWHALWLAWVVVAWAALPSLAQRLIWLGTLPGGGESGLLAFPPMAPWWSAGLRTPQGRACLSLDGGGWDAGPRHAGRRLERGLGRFRRWLRGGRRGWSNAAGYGRAFRWTAAGGMQDLGTLGGSWSTAYGVSADGSVVVGRAANAAGQWRAFRWTAAGGMQDLGTLGGDWSEAHGVSADGSVVVGWTGNAGRQWRAFRWTAARGMQDLGTLGGNWSEAHGVSADGSVVVGWAANAAGQGRAFRWTAARGMQDLGTLGGGRVRLGAFPPMAPWWSAGLEHRPRVWACLSLDGGARDGGPEHHLRPPADQRLGAL
jgi:probable HAF family extracellular repeat protein